MPADGQAQIDALRRAVVLLAETTRDALAHLRDHRHSKTDGRTSMSFDNAIDRTIGRLDAIAPMLDALLGPAAGEGRDGGGGT